MESNGSENPSRDQKKSSSEIELSEQKSVASDNTLPLSPSNSPAAKDTKKLNFLGNKGIPLRRILSALNGRELAAMMSVSKYGAAELKKKGVWEQDIRDRFGLELPVVEHRLEDFKISRYLTEYQRLHDGQKKLYDPTNDPAIYQSRLDKEIEDITLDDASILRRAVLVGNIDLVKWLNKKIFINQNMFNLAAGLSNPELIKWMASKDCNVDPLKPLSVGNFIVRNNKVGAKVLLDLRKTLGQDKREASLGFFQALLYLLASGAAIATLVFASSGYSVIYPLVSLLAVFGFVAIQKAREKNPMAYAILALYALGIAGIILSVILAPAVTLVVVGSLAAAVTALMLGWATSTSSIFNRANVFKTPERLPAFWALFVTPLVLAVVFGGSFTVFWEAPSVGIGLLIASAPFFIAISLYASHLYIKRSAEREPGLIKLPLKQELIELENSLKSQNLPDHPDRHEQMRQQKEEKERQRAADTARWNDVGSVPPLAARKNVVEVELVTIAEAKLAGAVPEAVAQIEPEPEDTARSEQLQQEEQEQAWAGVADSENYSSSSPNFFAVKSAAKDAKRADAAVEDVAQTGSKPVDESEADQSNGPR